MKLCFLMGNAVWDSTDGNIFYALKLCHCFTRSVRKTQFCAPNKINYFSGCRVEERCRRYASASESAHTHFFTATQSDSPRIFSPRFYLLLCIYTIRAPISLASDPVSVFVQRTSRELVKFTWMRARPRCLHLYNIPRAWCRALHDTFY